MVTTHTRFGLAALLALALTAPLTAQGLRAAATVSYVLGSVEISRGSTGSWRPAKVNQSLFAGDRIRTGPDGQAEIAFGGSSRLRLAERTDMQIPDQPENQGGLLQRIQVTLGSLWANVRRLARNESFEVEGGHSIGGVKGTRFQLQRRRASDLWRLQEGRLAIRRRGARRADVELTDGQEVEVEPSRTGRVRPAPGDELQESFTRMNRRVAQQWQSVLTKLLAAERRLVQQALREVAGAQIQDLVAKSREIGTALRDAQEQIRAFVRSRADAGADQRFGSGDLERFAERAVNQYERMHQQIETNDADRPGERPATGARAGDAQKIRALRQAEAFMNRYLQGLRRALRIFRRHLQGTDRILPLQFQKIRSRLVDGFRQSQQGFQRARQVSRRDETGPPSPRVRQAFRKVEQRWRAVERNFRLARELMARVKQSFLQLPDDPTRDLPDLINPGGPTGGFQGSDGAAGGPTGGPGSQD